MPINMQNKLSFLPKSKQIGTAFPEKLEQYLETVDFNKKKDFEQEISQLVVAKCTSQEEDNRWTKAMYLQFRKAVMELDNKNLEIAQTTLKKCLQAAPEEILENLEQIAASNQNFYPYIDRVYDSESKTYQIATQPIHQMDCYFLIFTILSKMLHTVVTEASKLYEQEQDYEVLYQSIAKVIQDNKEEEIAVFRKNFDNTFEFLKDTTLYGDLYEAYQAEFMKRLLKELDARNRLVKAKEYAQKNADFTALRRQSIADNHAKYKPYFGAFNTYRKRGKQN